MRCGYSNSAVHIMNKLYTQHMCGSVSFDSQYHRHHNTTYFPLESLNNEFLVF